jgi:hypothetical protein
MQSLSPLSLFRACTDSCCPLPLSPKYNGQQWVSEPIQEAVVAKSGLPNLLEGDLAYAVRRA